MYKRVLLFFCIVSLLSCSSTQTTSTQTTRPNFPEMTLRVISIGLDTEELSIGSSIIAEIEYEIGESNDLDITDLFITAQVATTDPNIRFDGSFPSSEYPRIEARKGKVTYKFPLRHVWYTTHRTMKMPIEIDFGIGYRVSETRSVRRILTDVYIFGD